MEKMTQHQLGQIKKDIQPSWCWAKVSEANEIWDLEFKICKL